MQTDIVLRHLRRNRTITPIVAFERYRITRLADVVLRLRRRGVNIATQMVQTGDGRSRFARYRLVR